MDSWTENRREPPDVNDEVGERARALSFAYGETDMMTGTAQIGGQETPQLVQAQMYEFLASWLEDRFGESVRNSTSPAYRPELGIGFKAMRRGELWALGLDYGMKGIDAIYEKDRVVMMMEAEWMRGTFQKRPEKKSDGISWMDLKSQASALGINTHRMNKETVIKAIKEKEGASDGEART